MSERRARRARAGAVAALAAILLLGPGAATALAQAPDSQQAVEQAVPFDLDPELVTRPKETTTTPVPEPGDLPEAASPTSTVAAPPSKQDAKITSGAGSAQLQPLESKKREAAAACTPKARALPISSMLGRPGSVGGSARSNWGLLLLAVAVASGAVALLIWWRRSRRAGSEPRDGLETVSTVVALVSTVVGLAVTFVPSIGIDQPPPPETQMAVREAYARITHGEYAQQTGTSAGRSSEDKREVGNVIWVELQLKGYADKPLRLQYGSYRAGSGAALLPGTTREINLGTQRDDVETTYVPLWIGYPRRTKDVKYFEGQLRLIDPRGRILQMAATGPMGASEFRYAC
ncbi:MAG: hypothetical protein QOJ63_3598 [Solirubrobacteraceae bacterium]|nr:hypothetical protein [Solirubrobacteraceae bacterium]